MSSNFSDHDKFCHGFHQWRYKLYKYKVTYFYYLCVYVHCVLFEYMAMGNCKKKYTENVL